jgi:hypothetical protein
MKAVDALFLASVLILAPHLRIGHSLLVSWFLLAMGVYIRWFA